MKGEINLLTRTHKRDMLILLERMVNEDNTKQIIGKLSFDFFYYTLLVNHYGGIWVLWNNSNFIARVVMKEVRDIHMLIYDNLIQKFYIVPTIYAPAQEEPNKPFGTIFIS